MRAKVRINNNKLLAIRSRQEAAISTGITETLNDIKELASQLAPKDTEALSKSGEVSGNGFRQTVSFGNGLEDIRAGAQEFGTMFHEAQPFLRPAMKAIEPTLKTAQQIAKLIK